MKTTRPYSLVVALILLVLLGVGHLFVPFVPDVEKIPSLVVYGDVVLGVTSLVAAFGLWQLRRWGLVLTFTILALNVASAVPGVLLAPNQGLQVVTAAYVILSILSMILLLLPPARQASAAK